LVEHDYLAEPPSCGKSLKKGGEATMTALTPWRPFAQLSTLHNEIDDLFARFFGEEERWWVRPFEGPLAPAVESFVRGDEYVVRADLPGVDPKDVEVSVEGDRLTIRGERKEMHEGNGSTRFYREIRYGRFERSLTLPPGVDTDSIRASYHNGVLEVTMKAPRELASKRVPITIH
jgi:HSP20 family protein